MGISEKLSRGAAWLALARLTTNLTALVSIVALTRLLQPADFGLVAIATSVYAIVSALTSMPVDLALVQIKDPSSDHYHSAFTIQAIRAFAVCLALIGLSFPVSASYADERLIHVFWGLAAVTLLSGFSSPYLVVLQRQLVFRQEFLSSVANRLTAVTCSIAYAYFVGDYWALVIGPIAGALAGVATSFAIAPYRPKLRLNRSRDLLSFSVNLSLSNVVNTMNGRADQLMVGTLGKRELGFYTVGGELAALVIREVIAPISQILFPAMSAINSDPVRLRAAVENATTTVVACALPIGVGFALVADPAIRLFLGEKWAPMIYITQLLALLYGTQSIMVAAQPLSMALNKANLLLRRDVLFLAIRLPLTLLGLWFGGLAGAVAVRFVLGFVHILLTLRLVRNLIDWPVREQIRSVWRSAFSAAAMVVALLALDNLLPPVSGDIDRGLRLLLDVVVGAAVYAGCHATLWLASGKPAGAEAMIIKIARSYVPNTRAPQGS